jgi:hypothetical protein
MTFFLFPLVISTRQRDFLLKPENLSQHDASSKQRPKKRFPVD